jgi:hypothetical protein
VPSVEENGGDHHGPAFLFYMQTFTLSLFSRSFFTENSSVGCSLKKICTNIVHVSKILVRLPAAQHPESVVFPFKNTAFPGQKCVIPAIAPFYNLAYGWQAPKNLAFTSL